MSFTALETERLVIREYTLADLDTHHRLMVEAFDSKDTLEEIRQWLEWTVRNYRELARLHQPPYGDYVMALKTTGETIGSVGLVPALIPWGVLPEFRAPGEVEHYRTSPEFGLFWAVFQTHQRQGYAAEAGRAMLKFAFTVLNAQRVVATTELENVKSQRVMQKIGMTIHRNPGQQPFWFQVVGVVNHSDARRVFT